MQLTVQDLWDNPAMVADFLNLNNLWQEMSRCAITTTTTTTTTWTCLWFVIFSYGGWTWVILIRWRRWWWRRVTRWWRQNMFGGSFWWRLLHWTSTHCHSISPVNSSMISNNATDMSITSF